MTGRVKASIRTRFVLSYSDMLVSVRRSAKGLRIPYLFSIQIVGEHSGLRLCEICELVKKTRGNMLTRLKRVEQAGYIRKENKRYYLTDSGRQVYNTICREFDASMNEIIAHLVREAVKRADG